jgi:hypothetical protein
MNSYNNPFYRSLLGISEIDSVNSAQINTQNITVASLGTGLVSSTSGTLGNATVGNGLSFSGNTLNNTGVTSIVSGQTGPVYISTSSTGSVEIALPQNLSVASSPNFTNLGVQNYLIVGSTSNTNSLLAASAGFVVNAISDPPLSYDNTTSRYSIALTGSTGIDYSVVNGVGYITNKFMTGPTGPQGIQGLTGYTGPIGITGPSNLTISNFNVFGGVNAGISRTTATGNVGIGYNALSSLTDSLNNVAVGTDALKVLTTTDVQGSNTAIGFSSLSQCSTGVRNTCIGSGSGRAVVGGRQNTALGMSSALNLTSGDNNVIIGAFSGGNILRANDNISIGNFSMSKGTSYMTGPDGRNVALGYYAGYSLAGYPTNNVAIGYQSLWNAGQVSDNIAIGTNSLATIREGGGGNIALGGSSTSVGGSLTNGAGYNIGVGIASNLYISANARNNIGIGAYSNFNTSTGISNISIGNFTQALSATGCNNIVLSTNGTISVPVSGYGDNTAFIDSRSGLYYYNPAICYLYATGLSGGSWVQWATYDTNNVPTKGFTLTNNNGRGANTTIEPNVYGHYEITINGAMLGNGSNLTLTMNNINVRQYNVWYQSFSTNGIAYSLSATMIARPFTTFGLSGFDFQLNNMTLWGGLSLFVCIKFIGF